MAKHRAPKKSNRIIKAIKNLHTEILMFRMIVADNKGDITRAYKLHNRLKSLRK